MQKITGIFYSISNFLLKSSFDCIYFIILRFFLYEIFLNKKLTLSYFLSIIYCILILCCFNYLTYKIFIIGIESFDYDYDFSLYRYGFLRLIYEIFRFPKFTKSFSDCQKL